MIISANPAPPLEEFRQLMRRSDALLNADASERPDYYRRRSGNPLEEDVYNAIVESASHTPFAGTIELVSGHKFPDIIANKLYGVEVKSTKDDHWTSTGSSILESTRIQGVERIFMTFGKLGGAIKFLSRPYEECLSDIAVTHMPRYLIDMRLKEGETIFDKMNIPYDTLRTMENPIAPISSYYRSQLKPGESLWWAGDNAENDAVSAKIQVWKNVSAIQKRSYTLYGCVHFPEIFNGNYDNYALWLTSRGVVDPHIRDQFSAGGQEEMQLLDGTLVKFPAVFRRIKEGRSMIVYLLAATMDPKVPSEVLPISGSILRKRLLYWIDAVAMYANRPPEQTKSALYYLFQL